MDRKLALRPRIYVPLKALRHRLTRSACWPPHLVRADALDEALEAQCPRVPQALYPSHRAPGPGHHVQQDHPRFHHDDDVDRDGHRPTLCAEFALPILRVCRVVYAIPAVESRLQSGRCICVMGRARVGVECVPEYTGKLGDGSGRSGDYGCGCMVGNEEGVRGRDERYN